MERAGQAAGGAGEWRKQRVALFVDTQNLDCARRQAWLYQPAKLPPAGTSTARILRRIG